MQQQTTVKVQCYAECARINSVVSFFYNDVIYIDLFMTNDNNTFKRVYKWFIVVWIFKVLMQCNGPNGCSSHGMITHRITHKITHKITVTH